MSATAPDDIDEQVEKRRQSERERRALRDETGDEFR